MPLRILVVDDDRDILRIYVLALRKRIKPKDWDYNLPEKINKSLFKVEAADSVTLALDKMRSQPFEILVVDLKIPGLTGEQMGGLELITESIQLDPLRPIIAITGFGSVELSRKTFTRGIFDFIEKSEKAVDDLIQAVQKAIDSRDEKIRRWKNPFTPMTSVGPTVFGGRTMGDVRIHQVDLKKKNLITYSNNFFFFRSGMIPYYYGTYIQDRTKFYGRVDEQKEILGLLNQASQKNYWHISVIGDYRSGKSSLLKILEDEIQLQLKSVSVYIDLSTISQQTFFQSVLSGVGESVFAKSNNNALIKKFKQIVDTKRVESIKSLGLELDIFKIFKIKTSPKNSESWELFKVALIALFKRLKKFGDFYSIVIIIDEVSAITTWDNSKEILKQWRGMVQNISGYNLVIGSAYPLYQLTKNEWSPFFNIFTHTKLNKLKSNEAEELINQPAKQVGLEFKKDLVKRIRDLSGDKPYYIQVICSTICQRLLKMGPNVKIDEDFIDLCIDHSIEILKDHLLSLWEKATPFQQQLLIDSAKSTSEYHKIDFKNLDTNCKTEVMLLNDRGLIERKNDSIRVCGILSCWLKNYI